MIIQQHSSFPSVKEVYQSPEPFSMSNLPFMSFLTPLQYVLVLSIIFRKNSSAHYYIPFITALKLQMVLDTDFSVQQTGDGHFLATFSDDGIFQAQLAEDGSARTPFRSNYPLRSSYPPPPFSLQNQREVATCTLSYCPSRLLSGPSFWHLHSFLSFLFILPHFSFFH